MTVFPGFVCNQKIKEFNNIIFVFQILCQKKLILYIEPRNCMCVCNICLYTLVFEFPVSIFKNLKFLTSWWLHEPRNSQKYKTTHVRNTFFCGVSVYFFIDVWFVRKKGGRSLWFPKVSVHLHFFAWITFCKVRKETYISDVLQNKIRYTRHIWSLLNILCWSVEMWKYSNYTYLSSTFTFCSITLCSMGYLLCFFFYVFLILAKHWNRFL